MNKLKTEINENKLNSNNASLKIEACDNNLNQINKVLEEIKNNFKLSDNKFTNFEQSTIKNIENIKFDNDIVKKLIEQQNLNLTNDYSSKLKIITEKFETSIKDIQINLNNKINYLETKLGESDTNNNQNIELIKSNIKTDLDINRKD